MNNTTSGYQPKSSASRISRSRSGSNMNLSDRSGGVVMKAVNFNTPNIPAISLGTLSNEGSLLMTNSTMGQRSI